MTNRRFELVSSSLRNWYEVAATCYGKPWNSMVVLPCPNPYGMLRVGRRGLNNPCGFWLFWLFISLFLKVVKPLLKAGSSGFGRECTFCLVL